MVVWADEIEVVVWIDDIWVVSVTMVASPNWMGGTLILLLGSDGRDGRCARTWTSPPRSGWRSSCISIGV